MIRRYVNSQGSWLVHNSHFCVSFDQNNSYIKNNIFYHLNHKSYGNQNKNENAGRFHGTLIESLAKETVFHTSET